MTLPQEKPDYGQQEPSTGGDFMADLMKNLNNIKNKTVDTKAMRRTELNAKMEDINPNKLTWPEIHEFLSMFPIKNLDYEHFINVNSDTNKDTSTEWDLRLASPGLQKYLHASNFGPVCIDADREYAMQVWKGQDEKNQKSMTEDKYSEYRETKQIADVFEMLISYSAQVVGYLGKHESAQKTLFHDDRQGIDLVIEHETEEGEPFQGLVIDVTTGFNQIERKLGTLLADIEKGKLATVKYFQKTFLDRKKGRVSDLPKVIIGLDPNSIKYLAMLQIEIMILDKKLSTAEDHKDTASQEFLNKQRAMLQDEMGNHWTKFEIMDQTIVQSRLISEHCEQLASGHFDQSQISRYRMMTDIYAKEADRYEQIKKEALERRELCIEKYKTKAINEIPNWIKDFDPRSNKKDLTAQKVIEQANLIF